MPDQPSHAVRLVDVAKHLGLDKSTVSLALRDDARIHETTKARVREAAQALGYVRDPLLSALSRRRSRHGSPDYRGVVAFLHHKSYEGPNWFPMTYFHGANHRGSELGYQVEMFDSAALERPEQITGILKARGVVGVILPSLHSAEIVPPLDFDSFTTVSCNFGEFSPVVPYARANHFAGVRMAFDYLYALGHRRIGFAPLRHLYPLEDDFLRSGAAWFEQFERLKRKDRVPLLHAKFKDFQAHLAWYFRYKPEAVICSLDIMRGTLVEAGVRIPEEVSYVSLSVSNHPQVTGVIDRGFDVGCSALELLDLELRSGRKGVRTNNFSLAIEPAWHEGKTATAPTRN